MKTSKDYKLVTKRPVAKFFFKGDHTHPVRRTILVVKETSKCIYGYELREGRTVRKMLRSPLRKYRKAEIARYSDYCRLTSPAGVSENRSTLRRYNLLELIKKGV